MIEYKSFLAQDMLVFLSKKKSEVQTQDGINSITNHLSSFDNYLTMHDYKTINEDVVVNWIRSLRSLSDGTINNYICDVQAFLVFENTWRHTCYFVPQYIREEQSYVPHIYTSAKKEIFYEAIDNYEPGCANKLPWILNFAIFSNENCKIKPTSPTIQATRRDFARL